MGNGSAHAFGGAGNEHDSIFKRKFHGYSSALTGKESGKSDFASSRRRARRSWPFAGRRQKTAVEYLASRGRTRQFLGLDQDIDRFCHSIVADIAKDRFLRFLDGSSRRPASRPAAPVRWQV